MSLPSKPSFSVVIPTLNEEKYLPNLLFDLSKQTRRDFEVIIVDGHSKDKTVEKVEGFKSQIRNLKIINSKIRNVSHQRNIGVKEASSNWIIFMDADNRLPDYFIEGVSYKIKLKNDPDSFTCFLDVDSNKPEDILIANTLNAGAEIIKLVSKPGAMGAMIGVKKLVFQKVGGFNVDLKYAEDWEFVKKVFDNGFSFEIFRDPKYVYSLRRIRRQGKLGSLRNYARIYTKRLTGQKIDATDYPMGGRVNVKEKNFFEKIEAEIKKLSGKPKFLKKIKSILDSLDSGN